MSEKIYLVTLAKSHTVQITARSADEAKQKADHMTDAELDVEAGGWEITDCFAEDGSDE